MGFFDFVRESVDPIGLFADYADEEDDPGAQLGIKVRNLISPQAAVQRGELTPEEALDPLGLFSDAEEEEEFPDVADDDTQEQGLTPAALAARRKALARKGRQSTFRTGGKGVVQTATTQKPTLIREG